MVLLLFTGSPERLMLEALAATHPPFGLSPSLVLSREEFSAIVSKYKVKLAAMMAGAKSMLSLPLLKNPSLISLRLHVFLHNQVRMRRIVPYP